MKSEDKLGSVKRFGSRYGRKPKLQFSKVEAEQRKMHKCPYCSKIAVKRVAIGIWNCRKCKTKFTGKAYSVSKEISVKPKKEIILEEPVAVENEVMEEE